jgi:hypothetical protein
VRHIRLDFAALCSAGGVYCVLQLVDTSCTIPLSIVRDAPQAGCVCCHFAYGKMFFSNHMLPTVRVYLSHMCLAGCCQARSPPAGSSAPAAPPAAAAGALRVYRRLGGRQRSGQQAARAAAGQAGQVGPGRGQAQQEPGGEAAAVTAMHRSFMYSC